VTLLQVVADAPSSKVSRSELDDGIDVAELLVRAELATSLAERGATSSKAAPT